MDIKQTLYYVFTFPVQFMKDLKFPIGQYDVSVWELFIYSFLAFITVKLIFGLIGGGGGDG